MISRNVTVTVSDESSVSDSKVILYRGDGNIIFNFDIQDGRYKYSTQSILETMGSPLSANATMLAPNGENVFQTPVLPVQENNIVQIAVNKDMIDDLTEIGTYKFQIHLYSDTKDRITLPPLDFEVSDTIGEAPMPNFNDGIVGFTKVGESYVAEGPVVTLKYTKNTWSIGDLITDKKLNNMESGIEANALNIEVNKSKIEEHGTAIQDIQTTIGELSGADTAILESIATNANNIAENTTNIQNNTEAIGANAQAIESNTNSIEAHTTSIEANTQAINGATTEITELKKSVNTNKSTILETKGEVEGARTGANGQIYSTLKERLDGEFEAIHQQIVDPYLDFEGERVIVEHSLEGQTKNMVVKGRTYQNLVPNFNTHWTRNSAGITINNDRKLTIVADGMKAEAMAIRKNFMLLKSNTVYTVVANITQNTLSQSFNLIHLYLDVMCTKNSVVVGQGITGIVKGKFTTIDDISLGDRIEINVLKGSTGTVVIEDFMILEGDWTNKEVPSYVEGIQSAGDKSKNLFNKDNITLSQKTLLIDCKAGKSYSFSYDYAGDYEGDVRVQLATTTEIQTTTGELSNVAEVKMVNSTIGRNTTTIKSTIDGYLYLRFVQTAFIGHISNIQLEEGTVATPYEHYYEGHKISILSNNKNLFDGILEIGSLTDGGDNHDDSTRVRTKNYIKIGGMKNIYISSSVDGMLGLRYYDSNKKYLKSIVINIANGLASEVTIANNVEYMRFSHVDNTDLNTKYLITSKNIGISDYEPYQIDKKEILLKEPGTMKYHPEISQGTIQATPDSTTERDDATRVRTGWFKCNNAKPFTVYGLTSTQKVAVLYFNEKKTNIGWTDWQNSVENKTLPSECVYVRAIFANRDNSSCTPEDFSAIFIDVFAIIPCLDGLKSLPNGVCDTLENREDGVYFVKKVGKVVLDGNIEYTTAQNDSDLLIVKVNNINAGDLRNIISNYIVKFEYRWDFSEWTESNYIGASFYNNTSTLLLFIPKSTYSTITDVTSLKAMLTDKPLVFYYGLEEPIETKLDVSSINLKTFKDITHVFSENSISPNLSFKAPVDTLATINALRLSKDNLINENAKLKEELQVTNEELAQLTTEQDLFKLDVDERLLNLELGGTIDVR